MNGSKTRILRRRQIICPIKIFSIVGLVFTIFFASNSALAASLDLRCPSENESIQNACDLWKTSVGTARGALWLSKGPDKTVDSVEYLNGEDKDKIKAYLYGSVYDWHDSTKYYASHIHVLSSPVSSYQSDASLKSKEVPYIDIPELDDNNNKNDVMYRGVGQNTSEPSFSRGWETGSIMAWLNLNKFEKEATKVTSETSKKCPPGNVCYKKTVHMYRCFGSSYNGNPGSCYSDPSTIFVVEPPELGGEFITKSEVSWPATEKTPQGNVKTDDNGKPERDKNGDPMPVQTITLSENQESINVTFNHYAILKLEGKNFLEDYTKIKKANAKTSFKISQYWYQKKEDFATGNAKVADMELVSGYKRYRKVVKTDVVNVKVDPNGSKMVCQRNTIEPTKITVVQDGANYKVSGNNGKNDYSQICVRVTRISPTSSSFYSQSGAQSSVSGKDQLNARANPYKITIPNSQSSQTVTFIHKIGSDANDDTYNRSVNAGAYTDWSVSQSSYNSRSVASGRTYMSYLSQEGSTRNTNVYTNNVTVSVGAGSTVTVCQRIDYKTKTFNITAGGSFKPTNNTGASSICVQIYREPPIRYCSQVFSGYYATTNYGNTLARSQVTNYTNGSSWKGEVYAKPGDEIQFRHALCFGDQAVTGSGRDGYGLDQYTTSRKRASSFNDYIFPANEFYLSGYSNDDYLFNRSDLTSVQTLRQNEKGVTRPTSFYDRFKPEDIFNDYGFQLYSPKNQSTGGFNSSQNLNQYSGFGCLPYVDGWNWGLGLNNSYRIPGFADDKKCQQAYGGIDSTNAGQTLAQALNYRKIDAWQAYRHSRSSARCVGCTSYYDLESAWEDNHDSSYSGTEPTEDPINLEPIWSFGQATWYRNDSLWGYLDQQCKKVSCANSGYQEKYSWSWSETSDYKTTYDSNAHLNCSIGSGGSGSYYDHTSSDGKSGSGHSYSSWSCHTNDQNQPDTRYNAPSRAGYSPTYPIAFDDYWTDTSARVKVPYNFTTTAKSTIRHSSSVVYAGEKVDASYDVTADKRMNPGVGTSQRYLTMTPRNTVVRFISFIVDKDYDAGDGSALKGGVTTFPSNGQWGNNDVVSYYKNKLGSHMIGNPESIFIDSNGNPTDHYGAINPEGELYTFGGVEEYGSHQTYSQSIPDVEPGSKYCVAVGVWHADSHGITSKQDLAVGEVEGVNGYALNGASPYWRISNASCRTIAKKPNFQAWGGFYTQGSITTSQSNKTRIGKLFGSWVDTLAVVGGTSKGFSSGAALGYIDTGGANNGTAYCKLVSMTIANSQCRSSTSAVGSSGSVPATGLLAQIRNRYTPRDKSALNSGYYSQLLNSDEVLYEHYKTSAYINLGAIIQNQKPGDKGKTRIIEIDGDVRINGNICVGSGSCSNIYSALSLGSRNSEFYRGGGDIPQVIIIANNIRIAPEVTQIDAWLFARGSTNNEGQASFGTINTCDAGHGSSDVCTKTIIFNGPVFAKSLILNRTAGAYPGLNSIGKIKYDADLANTGSITPAEIFNLRPDAYYWAYDQANRLSQASVVYMRELAPRF